MRFRIGSLVFMIRSLGVRRRCRSYLRSGLAISINLLMHRATRCVNSMRSSLRKKSAPVLFMNAMANISRRSGVQVLPQPAIRSGQCRVWKAGVFVRLLGLKQPQVSGAYTSAVLDYSRDIAPRKTNGPSLDCASILCRHEPYTFAVLDFLTAIVARHASERIVKSMSLPILQTFGDFVYLFHGQRPWGCGLALPHVLFFRSRLVVTVSSRKCCGMCCAHTLQCTSSPPRGDAGI
ncbi:hypothetical protein B0H21DRAFT_768038 [Amylocystis lapponica]|nr:hypothetical protein B0H21DRAFT_768038 [Amylocystis lapponica]